MWSFFKKIFGHKENSKPEPKLEVVKRSAEEIAKIASGINRFPVKQFSRDEFSRLASNVDKDFLKFCPFGTWFLCKPVPELPELLVVGQVVRGEDLLCDQYGAGLLSGPPERGINRYRLEVVD